MPVVNKVTVTRAVHFIRIKRMNNIMLLSMQLVFLPNLTQKNAIRVDSVNLLSAQRGKAFIIFTKSLHQRFINQIIETFFSISERRKMQL